MDVLFVSSFSPIVADPAAARSLYADAIGLDLEQQQGEYAYTHQLDGVKHFGLWPLSAAARSCFGTDTWPEGIPVPQASLELEVRDVAAAASELEAAGYELIHGHRTEPWGQEIARLLSPDGLLIGLSVTPWFRDDLEG